MKLWRNLAVWFIATGVVVAQAGSPAASPKRARKRAAAADAVTQTDLQALKDQLAAQQQQIQQLMDELRQRDAAWQQAQQQMQQNQAAAAEAQSKAAAAQQAADQSNSTVSQIQSDVKDVKSNATNAALTTQDEQKKLSALESALGRFRWSGDVRIRGESFSQKGAVDRNRARIRLRLGLEGDPNQDFTGGLYLASGFVTGSGASLKINRGVDSNAVGGYGSATLQFGPWKTTPSIMVMNWNGADPIAQAVSPVGLCSTNTPGQTTCILQPNAPAAGTPLPNPIATPSAFLQTNAMTNATRIVGSGPGLTRPFVSGFEYAAFIWDNRITTPVN